MNPGRAPERIGARHVANEGPHAVGEARSARSLRPPPPVPAESFAMPANHGRGLHEHEGVSPGRPGPAQSDPQEPVDGAEPRSAIASGQQFQLMPEREILEDQILASTERGPERRGEGEAEPKHAGSVSETTREGQRFRADRNIGEGQVLVAGLSLIRSAWFGTGID